MKLLVVLCVLGASSAQLIWQPSRNGLYPFDSIQAGEDNGLPLIMCRSSYGGDMNAGFIDILARVCIFGWNGATRQASTYDVPTGTTYEWVRYTRGQLIPDKAFFVGWSANRDRTFACRADHDDNLVLPGKLVRGICLVPVGNLEYDHTSSYVLLDPLLFS